MTWISNIEGLPSLTEEQPQRRGPTELPTAAELAEARTGRLARRTAIRRKIVAAELAEEKWRELGDAITTCLAEKEALAAAHCESTQPIQRELAAIESQQLDAAVAKQPRDAELERRHKQLADQIREANVALEVGIETQDRLIFKLGEERRVAGLASNRVGLTTDLVATSSPELAMAVRVTSGFQESAAARVSALQSAVERKKNDYSLAMLARAESELERAQQLATEAYQRALDEP